MQESRLFDNKSRDFSLTNTGCRYDHRYCDHAYPEKASKYVGRSKRDQVMTPTRKDFLGKRLNRNP